MTAERLHDFDSQLCWHVLDNVASHMGDADFAAFVGEAVDPAVVACIRALDDDAEPPPLLLSDAELEDLAGAFHGEEFQFDRDWVPYESLYRRSIDCAAEIRDSLAKQYADEWASRSARFAERLEARGVWLHHGIEVVQEWVEELRRLLRAMGATHLLPAPEGAFPTPTNPEPPPLATGAVPDRQENGDALTAAMAKTQALQEEIRDLLLSQRAVKDWYSTAEVGQLLNRAEYTVREWCRQGRIRAKKKPCGRGKGGEWLVSHEELTRLKNEGLLPFPRPE